MSECNSTSKIRVWIAFTLLFFLILPIYSNTFHASWQFDDKPNIVNNSRLHIEDLMPATLWKTFFAKPGTGEKLYRPLPCLTFAINWYFGEDNTTGYHVVNIIIHALNALFLYITILNLFSTPNLKKKYQELDPHFISLLSAALWAINPIQTQAVTYIVQRMASMAVMFYLLGIYFYLKGRLSDKRYQQVLFSTACLISYICALGSKENAAMLPLSLVLIEIIFFGTPGLPKIKRKVLWVVLASLVVILFVYLGALFIMKNDAVLLMLHSSKTRPFSIFERLITEPKIVLYYLTQIFYPVPNRLSIAHDVAVSTSLIKPWTTLPSILMVFCLIGIGFSQIRKRPFFSFGILFFFLNHIVESSIIPLDLIFEHRNYLPSLFLFFPVSVGINRLLKFYAVKKNSMYSIIIVFVTLLLIGLGWSTYIRNMAWATEKTLWIDAMTKAPGSERPLSNLAVELAWGDNVTPDRYEKALQLFEKSLFLYKTQNYYAANTIGNMASIYYFKHEYQKAVELYKKALEIDPEFVKVRYDLIKPLVLMGKWEEASKNADIVLLRGSVRHEYYNIKGFILLWQERPEKALPYFRKALSLSPNNSNVLLSTGVALSLMGKHKNAEWFMQRAAQNSPNDIMVLFSQIENSLRAGDVSGAEKYTERLFALFSLKSIKTKLKTISKNYHSVPVSKELIAPIIKKKLMEMSKEIQ